MNMAKWLVAFVAVFNFGDCWPAPLSLAARNNISSIHAGRRMPSFTTARPCRWGSSQAPSPCSSCSALDL